MSDKIICNHCNQEIDCFERISDSITYDTWVLNNNGKYEYVQFEDSEVLDVIKLKCNNCGNILSGEVQDEIFENME